MENVMTVAEYCDKFNKSNRTIQGICKSGKLPEHALEVKQSGRTWLLRIDPTSKPEQK
jgi:hypothetical protein